MALCMEIHGSLCVVLALFFHRFNAQVTIIKSGSTQLKLLLKTAISYPSENIPVENRNPFGFLKKKELKYFVFRLEYMYLYFLTLV